MIWQVEGDNSVYSVAISSSGSIVEAEAPLNNNDESGSKSGHIHIFKFIQYQDWDQFGSGLGGEESLNYLGMSVIL